MENNTSRTAICSSCVATLPAESAITSAKHAGKDLQHHDADVEGRPRVEPSQTIPVAYISQLSRLRPLGLGCNLRQYNAAFKFTSLGYDIVSAEERNANNIRDEFNAFQIHGALCHRQGPLIPYEDSEPSYAQLYIYDPSFAAQRRSERNENLNLEIITELSTMLSHFLQ
ncbi:hypothetical protein G6F70_009064 [Rhizopus microsporus]|nr:hypothetical protein G6F71_009018 [Rhizopus microsporus]KAG1193469.1 hypothetical protein G6F70_009064 [Rhizopus microsporus]KAG1206167.1 hypothetical protein G6F69_009028 [Rhizopus microsporus]KAG1226323.1 hypothetical protein G6F67_009026 [Rhizopus microsporus]KAG1257813.1 hypothetical protein G6F68_009123 [Rhizopus microsporus]